MAGWKTYFKKGNRNSNKKEVFYYNVEDYDLTYLVPKRILAIVSLRFMKEDSKFKRLCWNTFYWFSFGNLLIAAAQQFINIVIMARNSTLGESMDILRSLPCAAYAYLAMAKSFYYVAKQDLYKNLVTELREMWPKGFVSKEEHDIINRAKKQLMFVTQAYYWCNISLMIIFMVPPLYMAVKRLAGYEAPWMMPFFFWYPFDPFQPIIYEVALCLQTWLGTTVVLSIVSGDTLFCIFLSHITTQFDLLSLRIRKLFYVPIDDQLKRTYPLGVYSLEYFNRNDKQTMKSYDDKEWEVIYQKEILEIIQRHLALIRLAGDVESLNGFQLLVNFFNSSILLCFCGFCCVIIEKVTEILYKIFLSAILLQTWLLCWYGHRLLESSIGVSHALYCSGWYTTSNRIRKVILIMLRRSQKAVCVTTYGFSVISLASYTMIIKTAWSYFTLLLNIYKK
ncbi:odorant receptor 4-like [Galleria mellonella]|uniref:Odorant receptor n=1 Tax=Galleria mellonella TaxID=7137 RepID=A0A6J1WIN1_GALME|nr:odorant receptor 4-like [Galleria mellonella]